MDRLVLRAAATARRLVDATLLDMAVIGLASVSLACESTEKPSGSTTTANSLAAATSAGPVTAAAELAPSQQQCPAGRWYYDYSDQALEVMMKNLAGARVVKEEGDFVCEIPSGQKGAMTCSTNGKPVVNVVEANQAGIPMTVSVEFKGDATTQFELVGAGKMKVHSSDTSKFELKTQLSLGGKDVPFPVDKLASMFGNSGTIIEYKCDGGNLSLKPTVEGQQTEWQELRPAK